MNDDERRSAVYLSLVMLFFADVALLVGLIVMSIPLILVSVAAMIVAIGCVYAFGRGSL